MSLSSHQGTNYPHGFITEGVEFDIFPKGLDEDIVRKISEKKEEPPFLLEFRLKAFRIWKKLQEPHWGEVDYNPMDYQDMRYFAAPKKKGTKWEDVDEEILKTFERLGVPLQEQKRVLGVAVDAVFDSVSLGTTHQETLAKYGVIFCSFSEAVKKHPHWIQKYLASVVPPQDNFFAALNSAVFSDGSFVYVPPGVTCPLDLSTYFRMNAAETGQFERTLIIADKGSKVRYLEGCTAPMRLENQLHGAVVELIAMEGAQIEYTTVQNWYAGDDEGRGGIYNFVTKRGLCKGDHSKISWTQVETGSALTWKYPSVVLQGAYSQGHFHSVALTTGKMKADTGTKMIHIGPHTKSRILSKGISAKESLNVYRGLVKFRPTALGARNHTTCDSLLLSPKARAYTYPTILGQTHHGVMEHEATTSKMGSEELFYCRARGLSEEEAVGLLLRGFCQEVFQHLPTEFSVEAVKLLEMKFQNSLG